ncbi:MAG: hypothetical protein WCF12_06920, partial [Propionicimonas sp.]
AGDSEANVVATSIDIAARGTEANIGAAQNDLEIESSHAMAGDVGLEAAGSIWLTETRGTLHLVLAKALGGDVVLTVRETATQTPDPAPASFTGDLTFDGTTITRSDGGSFIDNGFQAFTTLRIQGGTPYDGYYTIATVEALVLTLTATLGATLGVTTEARTGVTLTGLGTLDEDLDLLRNGSVRFAESDPDAPRTVGRGTVAAAGSVLLQVGDDVTTTANSQILAGTSIDIVGDWRGTAPTNGDVGWGTTILLLGDITPGNTGTVNDTFVTNVWGNTDVDRFTLGTSGGDTGGTAVDSAGYSHLGGDTRIHGSQVAPTSTSPLPPADDGEDVFTVYFLQTMNVAAGHTLVLDGQADTDSYTVYSSGTAGSDRNYVINVLDTGAPDDGVDVLAIFGRNTTAQGAQYPTDDIFLLRAATAIPGEAADRPAFVAVLHATVAQAAPSGIVTQGAFAVERIGYDTAINGRLRVFGLGGNDRFASDDTSALVTLDGGSGNDTFQVGQIYGLKRDSGSFSQTAYDTGSSSGGSVAAGDVFGTVATTRGWVSRGASQPLLAQGSDGDDTFVVYSNQAPLRLEGDDGNDQFIVRAFALAQTTGDCGDPNNASCQIVWRNLANRVAMPLLGAALFSTAADTEIRTGAGQNQVQYNVNAPVSIDGGGGIDKVVVLGTEFADHIVVTAKAIYGAGLAVSYANVEVLEIDGLEGDDLFDILSTAAGVATRVIGGLGSDVINVAGDVTGSVVSRDIEGSSGSVNHDVASTDALYDGLAAPGVDVTVGRGTQGQVVIEETAGFTEVREGESADSYLVYLAQAPLEIVYLTVSAARSSSLEAVAGGDTIVLSETPPVIAAVDYDRDVVIDGAIVPIPKYAIVLVFTPTAWDKANGQIVTLMAVDDTLAEGDRVIVVSHSVISKATAFDAAVVRNVEVTVRDDDKAAVQVVQLDPRNAPDNTTVVIEGTTTTQLPDAVIVRLATNPGGAVVVRVTLSDDRGELSGPAGAFATYQARAVGRAGIYDVTIAAGAWQTGVPLTLHAVDDFVRQDPHTLTLSFGVVSTLYADATPARIDALVHDDDTPGVVVVETGGGTHVVLNGANDSYAIRLTQQPDADVQVAIVTDGQTDVVAGAGVTYQAIGGSVTYRQFTGSLQIADRIITRIGDSVLGNFNDEGFAAGQRIRIGGATAEFVIDSVAADGQSLVLRTAPTAGSLTGTFLTRVVSRGLFTGRVVYDATAGTLRRTDGRSWLDDGFLEGQVIQIGTPTDRYKIQLISSGTGVLDVITLTGMAKPIGDLHAEVTVLQWAAVVTFTTSTWHQPVSVELSADPWFALQPGQENLKSFAKRPHLLSGIRGPLAVEGGTTSADRSLRAAILLPGESNAPL